MTRSYAYPGDVSDEEWTFVLPYLLLSKEDSASRRHGLRAVFDASRSLLRAGCGWRRLPGDLRGMIRLGEGRSWSPSAAVLDSRPPRTRRGRGWSCWSSHMPARSAGSCCCPGDGSWNARSRG